MANPLPLKIASLKLNKDDIDRIRIERVGRERSSDFGFVILDFGYGGLGGGDRHCKDPGFLLQKCVAPCQG